jgi:hypothetical protein
MTGKNRRDRHQHRQTSDPRASSAACSQTHNLPSQIQTKRSAAKCVSGTWARIIPITIAWLMEPPKAGHVIHTRLDPAEAPHATLGPGAPPHNQLTALPSWLRAVGGGQHRTAGVRHHIFSTPDGNQRARPGE